MSGLVLKLAPKERLLINGAVIENGDRRSRVTVITSHARILRLRDAIHPKDANTPVKRACYLAQILLSGDADMATTAVRLKNQINDLKDVFRDQQSSDYLSNAEAELDKDNAYVCLKFLRRLIPLENRLLERQL